MLELFETLTERKKERKKKEIGEKQSIWQHLLPNATSHGDMAHKTAPSNCDEYDL